MKLTDGKLKLLLESIERLLNKDPSRFYALLLFFALMAMIVVVWKLEQERAVEIPRLSQNSR
jgi:hypothetical protein